MRSPNSKKRTQTSFLLSLILHVVMALVLGFILLEPPQEEAAESLAVDMISAARRANDKPVDPARIRHRQARGWGGDSVGSTSTSRALGHHP